MSMRILVVRFSSIGDIVLTTPVFRLLKVRFPDAEVHWVTKASFAGVLDGNSNIDKVWKWDVEAERLELKKNSFDFIVDLQKNARSRQVKWMFLGTPNATIRKENLKKILWVVFKQHRLRKFPWLSKRIECKSFTRRCIDVLSIFKVEDDHQGLDFYVDSNEVKEVMSKLGNAANFVCLSLGGSFFTKRLPRYKWQELIGGLNRDVVFIGGNSEMEEADGLEKELLSNNFQFNVVNLVGKLSLKESAAVVKLSEGVITGDTGMLHISAALGKNVQLLWGNTIPEFGMVPPLKAGTSLMQHEVTGLGCRPCSKLGFGACPKGHFNCMNNLQI